MLQIILFNLQSNKGVFFPQEMANVERKKVDTSALKGKPIVWVMGEQDQIQLDRPYIFWNVEITIISAYLHCEKIAVQTHKGILIYHKVESLVLEVTMFLSFATCYDRQYSETRSVSTSAQKVGIVLGLHTTDPRIGATYLPTHPTYLPYLPTLPTYLPYLPYLPTLPTYLPYLEETVAYLERKEQLFFLICGTICHD